MPEKNLVVIGAGIGRTGTMSLKLALSVLMSKGNDDADFLLLLDKGEATDEVATSSDLKNFLNLTCSPQAFRNFISSRGLAAVVDFPMSFYWKKLMELYPDAKVILTIRSPESWYKSYCSTVYRTRKIRDSFPVSWFLRFSKKDEVWGKHFNRLPRLS